MALTQTNNIIIEKEKLLRELNELREAHKKVQDERDELMLQVIKRFTWKIVRIK